MAYISQIKLGTTTYDISAYKLKNARTINLTGAVTGSANFDGTADISINTTLTGSHTHDQYLPLTAGEDKKLVGPLGLTVNENYGPDLPTDTFDGQLFFLEDSGAILPTGGTAGQVLVKISSADNDATWQTLTVSNKFNAGTTSGPSIQTTVGNYTSSAVTIPTASDSASGVVTTGSQTFAGQKTFSTGITLFDQKQLQRTGYSRSWYNGRDGALIRQTSYTGYNPILSCKTTNGSWELGPYTNNYLHFVYSSDTGYNSGTNTSGEYTSAIKLASTGVLYGAAWNDYAEFRTQQEHIEPGYCVASADNGKVYKTTEKFQACDGIVSDTFGFSIGETDECKTPLAVAGRVLAYFHGNRKDYHAGDTVCAGPEGKVMKMTREEICEWPDRIIGIVSEIPEYNTWGTGNIEVNERIWIKVK